MFVILKAILLLNSCFVSQVQEDPGADIGSEPQLKHGSVAKSPTPGAPGPTRPPTLCSQRGSGYGWRRMPRSLSGQRMAAVPPTACPLLGWQPHRVVGGQPARRLLLAGVIQTPHSRYTESPGLGVTYLLQLGWWARLLQPESVWGLFRVTGPRTPVTRMCVSSGQPEAPSRMSHQMCYIISVIPLLSYMCCYLHLKLASHNIKDE